MSFNLWLAFVAASAVVTVLPGPSMLLVISHAMTKGPKKSLATVAGVVAADACLLCLALAGVGAVIYSSAVAFTVMKWLGAIYLIYLGIRQWIFASKHGSSNGNMGRQKLCASDSRHGFFVGYVTTMLNPKIIGFFIAFLPQFLVSGYSWAIQLGILGATFLSIVFAIMATYALLAGRIRGLIYRTGVRRALDRAAGTALIGAGVITATLRRT
jgi:threonine/homoserine/homoserine lactone efflux protein